MILGLNAWQFLLWILALAMIVSPFIVGIINSVITGYFKAKDAHIGRIAKAIGATLEGVLDGLNHKLDDIVKGVAKK